MFTRHLTLAEVDIPNMSAFNNAIKSSVLLKILRRSHHINLYTLPSLTSCVGEGHFFFLAISSFRARLYGP